MTDIILIKSKRELRTLIQELGAVSPIDQLFLTGGKVYLIQKTPFNVYGDILIDYQGEKVIDLGRKAYKELSEEQQDKISSILSRYETTPELSHLTVRVNYFSEDWKKEDMKKEPLQEGK